jgi:hypothetical protein
MNKFQRILDSSQSRNGTCVVAYRSVHQVYVCRYYTQVVVGDIVEVCNNLAAITENFWI